MTVQVAAPPIVTAWYTAIVRATVETATLPADTARLVVVADTHSAPHPATLALVAARAPQAILHAGDIGDAAVIDQFAAIAPTYAIRGNIDPRDRPDELELTIGALRVLVVHIGVAGPRLRGEVARRARAASAALVICGHSHVPFIGLEGKLTVFNPGSCGPRRFHLPIVFGAIDLVAGRVRLSHVDCETGEPWLPPAAHSVAPATRTSNRS
jgi:putative phosphoesterase